MGWRSRPEELAGAGPGVVAGVAAEKGQWGRTEPGSGCAGLGCPGLELSEAMGGGRNPRAGRTRRGVGSEPRLSGLGQFFEVGGC